jgi:hypothetical protein
MLLVSPVIARHKSSFRKCLILGAMLFATAGCVYEPYPPPPPPPPGPVAVAPGPYYAGPCCYAYPEYPSYPGYYYGPSGSVNLSFGRGGWGGHHWH